MRDIAETALWTAAYRAEESDRPDALFHDPYARLLAGERGREYVRRVQQSDVRWAVVLRTVVLDDVVLRAIRAGGCDAVVSLGAGLDTRPYRLDLPGDLRWIEVDLPHLVEYKSGILWRIPARCRVESRGVDLADRAARQDLLADIGASARHVLVLAEGLLGYLSPGEVSALACDLHAQPAFATWVTHFFGPHAVRRIQHAVDQLGVEGSSVKFAPHEGTDFFRPYGWAERERLDLFDEAVRRGRNSVPEQVPGQPVEGTPPEGRGRIIVTRLGRVASVPGHRPPAG